MAAHDGAVVPEEEMWPSPFSKDAAHWPNGGFKLEVSKKLTRGQKKRLNKANREKVLKDEVMNVIDANNDVFKMKNDVFRPSHSGPSPSKSPPSSDKKEPESKEKMKSKEKSKSKRKKQKLMIKSDRCFFLLPLTTVKIISD